MTISDKENQAYQGHLLSNKWPDAETGLVVWTVHWSEDLKDRDVLLISCFVLLAAVEWREPVLGYKLERSVQKDSCSLIYKF